MNPHVFISYSRENQHQVVRLVEYLREQGLAVWMDETDIHGATMWTEEIVEAIHKCKLFILAISRHSTGSKNVVKELALASEREKIILPIYLEQCDIPKNMEYQLAGIQNIALHTLDKTKAFEFVHQTILRLGVGQIQETNQSLSQSEVTPSAGHHPGAGHGHMAPPKAKNGIAKWIAITTSIFVLALTCVFLIQNNGEAPSPRTFNTSASPTTPATSVTADETARIALLPIEVNAPSEDDNWVGGGMGTQLRAAINKLDQVTVISGVSVNTFRGTNRDINKIRENLNVNYILDCEMSVVGKTVTTIVEFINAKSSQAIWSKTYEDSIDSIFKIKSDIATKIANSIGINVKPTTVSAISNALTANSEAFKLYSQGRTLWITRSQTGLKQSIKLYEKAVALDEQFALAYAGIADSYSMLSHYGYMDYDDGYPKARQFVLESISRNPNLAEPYVSLGWIQFAYEWKLKDSEKNYRKAISLNPKIADGYHWLGINLTSQMRYEDAYEVFKDGLKLDPNHPIMLANFAAPSIELNKFDEAIKAIEKGISLNPDYLHLWGMLYQAYYIKNNKDPRISKLINELENLSDKNVSIYATLTHYYQKQDKTKFTEYLNAWKNHHKSNRRTAFPMYKIFEAGIDEFINLAKDAYVSGRLAYGFTHHILVVDHHENQNCKEFIQKISKGK